MLRSHNITKIYSLKILFFVAVFVGLYVQKDLENIRTVVVTQLSDKLCKNCCGQVFNNLRGREGVRYSVLHANVASKVSRKSFPITM